MKTAARFAVVCFAIAGLLPTPAGAKLNDSPFEQDVPVPTLSLGQATLAPMAHVMFCLKNAERCAPGAAGTEPVVLTQDLWLDLQRTNKNVNLSIRPQLASADEWIIAPRAGDCNDYAVTKQQALIESGWSPSSVLLAEVITRGRQNHLVVVVRTRQGDFVLDNLSGAVRPWSKTGYTWVRIQTPENPRYWAEVNALDAPSI